MAQELMVMGEEQSVSLWRKPEQVLAEASEAAAALVKVVSMKKNPVKFNNEIYLEFEDWQTVSKFYGCTTKIVSTNLVDFDGVRGFEATAVVLDRHQNEIGRVDSMCLSDEKNWGDVPEYEWVNELDGNGKKIWVEGKNGKKGYYKGEKKEIGRSPKPLFQLRSMAQTRAQVKALRSIFSWVVVMAGYQPTPAEELTGNEFGEDQGGEEPRKAVEMPKAIEKIKIEGVIGSRGVGKDGSLWLNIGDNLVAVPVEKIGDHQFEVGHTVVFLAIEKQGKERKFLVLQSVEEYVAGNAKVADKPADSGEKKSEEPIGDLEETRTGKMGRSREVRLYQLMTQNKDKTGITRDIVHEILNKMDPPVAHLSDLDKSFFTSWERLMKGEDDWRKIDSNNSTE